MLRREDFRRRVEESPAVAWALMQELSQRLRRADEQIGNSSAARCGRGSRLLLDAVGESGSPVIEPATHQTIAQMIGASRETVSRAMREFQDRGLDHRGTPADLDRGPSGARGAGAREGVTLTVKFWGTRGSVPAPGPSTVRYGGNTPCLEVRTANDALLVFDAGTGIRELGRALIAKAKGKPIAADIFLGHAHWDHIHGLPYFQPLFTAGNRFTIWSTSALLPAVKSAVREQMSPNVFPVPFDEVASTVEFRALGDAHKGDGFIVRPHGVRHSGWRARLSRIGGRRGRAGAGVYLGQRAGRGTRLRAGGGVARRARVIRAGRVTAGA